MAGLGRAAGVADPTATKKSRPWRTCWWWGGGIAGLSAAVSAAQSGAHTLLLAGGAFLGGALSWRTDADIDALVAAARRAGVRILTRTMAFGVYDHGLVCARESLPPGSTRTAALQGDGANGGRPRSAARASMRFAHGTSLLPPGRSSVPCCSRTMIGRA